MSATDFVLGAVAYDPKVVSIWDGFRRWFRDNRFPFDYVLYSNYERQVEDLLVGRIDVAWNSPLAWVRSDRMARAAALSVRAVVMRDTDQNLRSVIVVPSDSPVQSLADLAGKTIGTGAIDSPQATLLPLSLLSSAGLDRGSDVTVRHFDVGVGLHGDHVGGEREAARALRAGELDAACMIDSSLLTFAREGTLPSGFVRVIAQTDPYDHCNMTAAPDMDNAQLDRFVELLLTMSYADPDVRPLLDLEGLKGWRPGRTSGYAQLERAVDDADFYDSKGAIVARGYQP